jgi:hypothetical protein
MEYVLIIILNLGGMMSDNTGNIEPRIVMQDFYDKKACENAKDEITRAIQKRAIAKAVCMEKGK